MRVLFRSSPIASRVRVSRSVAPPPPEAAPMPKTLFDKLWDAHIVSPERDSAPAVLYVDLHLIHEVTSPQALAQLDPRGLRPRRADQTGRAGGGTECVSTCRSRWSPD